MLVEGRIVEERIVKDSFVLEGARFDRTKDGHRLTWSKGVTGRIAIDGGRIVELAGEGSLALGDDVRGKVVLQRVTLLFQLVEAPPATSRPQLPLAVQSGNAIDWRLTIIAALSFLVHFGFVGSMYSDWTDGAVDENVDISGLVDLSRTVPQAIPLETPLEHPTSTPTSSSTSTSTSTRTSSSTSTMRSDPNARAAALSRQAEAMQMELLSAFGGANAVDNALRRSNIPSPDLDEAARRNSGVKPGEDLKLAVNDGIVTPGDGDGLSKLGVTQRGPDHKVIAHDVEGPKTTIDFTIKDPIGPAPVRNLEAAIAKLRPSFRSCYNKGIQGQPDMEGKVVLRVRLDGRGEVQSVEKVSGAGLSEGVEQCSMNAIKKLGEFDAPGGTGSSFEVPISFFTQKH